jgi:hypothetical protein
MRAVLRYAVAAGIAIWSVLGIGLIAQAHAEGGGCSGTCFVGGSGTGGEQSDGSASGFHYQHPILDGETTLTNSGSDFSGHIGVSGNLEGTANGACSPQGMIVGHYTGVFSDWSGGTC